nr:MAG TPA: hypothetical protein [Caudoviricetes sp.]
MGDMIPLYGFGSKSGRSFAILTITAPVGATVTVSKDGKSKPSKVATTGTVVFKGLETGTWTITITNGTDTATKTVEIKADYSATISFNTIPEFTYTGDFEIVSDDDQPITVSQGNWKIRFLTSGTLTFTNLNGAENGIDVFLVGGGGGGSRAAGGGGYTKTLKAVKVSVGTAYLIEIGAGGIAGVGNSKAGSSGGTSSAFGVSANGGEAKTNGATSFVGANGGSGGGAGSSNGAGGKGGSDGSDGFHRNGTNQDSGKGQGTTTREFGESGGKLYAGGGGGGTITSSNGGAGGDGGGGDGGNTSGDATSGATNTGSGGGGAANSKAGGAGGSGIVIIRNTRGAA